MGFYRKILLIALFIFCITGIFAAPLESGYTLAPRFDASAEERSNAYINARLRVVDATVRYLGTPYRYGGMSAAGVDCSGLLLLGFSNALGVALPRSASDLYNWAVDIPIERAQPGDLVFFRTGITYSITHVGLYLGNRRFIHAASDGPQTGVIYSNLDEQYYRNTFAGAGRVFPETAPFSLDNRPAATASSSVTAAALYGNETNDGPPVTIVNNTGYTVYYVYVSPSKSTMWGPDRLTSDQILRNGESVTIRLPYQLSITNEYDFMMIDFDDGTYTKFDVIVSSNNRIIFTLNDISIY